MTAPAIEVFADVRCPFAHVGLRRVVDERSRRGVTASMWVRAWPLELVNGTPLDPGLIAEEIEALRAQVAPELFRGFTVEEFATTSIPAMALTAGAYAIRPEVGERVALALRWALFEEGRDIAAPAVLLDIAEAAGMALPRDCEIDRVHDDWEEGRERGVRGSPHFFLESSGWFCPALDITRERGHLRIATDDATLDQFIARALACA